MSLCIGGSLALLVGVMATWTGLDRDRSFYPTVMIVIASYYILFAVMGGSTRALLTESAVLIPFLLASIAGFKRTLWLVVAALAAHGVLDLTHAHLVSNPGVPGWWPNFCLAYDVMAAGYLGIRWMGTGVPHQRFGTNEKGMYPESDKANWTRETKGGALKAQGRILFWEGASLWILRTPPGQTSPKTDPHSHPVVQVTLALTGRIDFDGEGRRASGKAIAIAPNSLHAFAGTGLVAHLFVAPYGTLGRQIVRRFFSNGPIASIPARRLGDLPARLAATFEDPSHTNDDLRALGRRLIARLGAQEVRARPIDPRIAKLIAWLAARLEETVSLSDAATFIGLSLGRARHLFVQQTGIPFRRYLLWLRLMRAVEIYSGGAALADAARGAGFADSAHLSRTFRRMFGIAATSLRLS